MVWALNGRFSLLAQAMAWNENDLDRTRLNAD